MDIKFKQGSTVYSEVGQAAEYVAKIPEGHIVRPEVEAYDGDEEYTHLCDPVTWRAVFKSPPTEKYSAELNELHKQLAATQAELQRTRALEHQQQREQAAKFKKTGILKNVEDFLDGKITHYVQTECYGPPQIVAVADAVARGENSSYRQSLRLLTLGGSLSQGKLSWVLGEYADGSGSGKGVDICRSLEEAEAIVKKALEAHFSGKNTSQHKSASWVSAADKLGVTVPDEYRVTLAKARLHDLENGHNFNYAKKQVVEYQKQADAVDKEIAELRVFLGAAA